MLREIVHAVNCAWNPTNTNSAIIAITGYLNQGTNFPTIEKLLQNPILKAQSDSLEFKADLAKVHNLREMIRIYPKGSLGFEYATFMATMKFEPLQVNLSHKIPLNIQNYLKLAFRNHDLVHLLYKLYDQNPLNITDIFIYFYKSG